MKLTRAARRLTHHATQHFPNVRSLSGVIAREAFPQPRHGVSCVDGASMQKVEVHQYEMREELVHFFGRWFLALGGCQNCFDIALYRLDRCARIPALREPNAEMV